MMTFAPPMLARPGEIVITPYSLQSIGVTMLVGGGGGAASANWIAANVVIFIPFRVIEAITITKLFWSNGAAVAGNLDAGIYDTSSNLLVSTGTTAQAGTTNAQVVDVTDTTIGRGVYYMALVSDTSGATQKINSVAPAAGLCQSYGLLEQAGVTLPLATNASPATFAKYTRAFIPYFGLQAYRAVGP